MGTLASFGKALRANQPELKRTREEVQAEHYERERKRHQQAQDGADKIGQLSWWKGSGGTSKNYNNYIKPMEVDLPNAPHLYTLGTPQTFKEFAEQHAEGKAKAMVQTLSNCQDAISSMTVFGPDATIGTSNEELIHEQFQYLKQEYVNALDTKSNEHVWVHSKEEKEALSKFLDQQKKHALNIFKKTQQEKDGEFTKLYNFCLTTPGYQYPLEQAKGNGELDTESLKQVIKDATFPSNPSIGTGCKFEYGAFDKDGVPSSITIKPGSSYSKAKTVAQTMRQLKALQALGKTPVEINITGGTERQVRELTAELCYACESADPPIPYTIQGTTAPNKYTGQKTNVTRHDVADVIEAKKAMGFEGHIDALQKQQGELINLKSDIEKLETQIAKGEFGDINEETARSKNLAELLEKRQAYQATLEEHHDALRRYSSDAPTPAARKGENDMRDGMNAKLSEHAKFISTNPVPELMQKAEETYKTTRDARESAIKSFSGKVSGLDEATVGKMLAGEDGGQDELRTKATAAGGDVDVDGLIEAHDKVAQAQSHMEAMKRHTKHFKDDFKGQAEAADTYAREYSITTPESPQQPTMPTNFMH